MLELSGVAQTVYLLGLVRMYRAAELSVVYPLSRALPVLLLALVEAAWGRWPTWLPLAGMVLVVAGSVLAPRGERGAPPTLTWRTNAWLGVSIVATVVYTLADRQAMELLPARASVAARYCVWETFASVPFLAAAGRLGWPPRSDRGAEDRPADRRWIAATAILSFASYALVLGAYQLGARSSWASALRQVSIPLGVLGARVIQSVTRTRASGALVITAGVACLVLGR